MGDSSSTKRVEIYSRLVSEVLNSQREMVGLKRLMMFMDRASNKYPLLKSITVDEDFHIHFPADIGDEEEILKTLFMILACQFKALEMFIGSSKARTRIVEATARFRQANPEIEEVDLEKYLPKEEEEEKDEEAEVVDIGETAKETEADDGYVPYYDEKKKEWVMKPADFVSEITREGLEIEPVYEDHAKFKGRRKPKKEKTTASQKKPKKAVQINTRFLQEEFPTGDSLIVEGPGEEKTMLCIQFIKEALESNMDVAVILGYSPDKFLKQLESLGTSKSLFGRMRIVDWSTFKERLVTKVETRGNRHIIPKDPKFLSMTLTNILKEMDPDKEKRAFVAFISQALAFIDFETVYNFAQITKLKFRKANVTGLFTIEKGQHSKDVLQSFKELYDGSITVKEGISGANTWKMKIEMNFVSPRRELKKDVIIMRNSVVVLDGKREKKATEDVPDGERLGLLQDKIDMWKRLGFDISPLEAAGKRGKAELEMKAVEFEASVDKALDLKKRLESPNLEEFSGRVEAIRSMLKSVSSVNIAEQELEKLEAQARMRLTREEKRRDREKEIFRIRMEHWRRQGYDVTRLERVIDHDLDTVNREFAAFRSVVNRLKEIEEELEKLDLRGHEAEAEHLRKILTDVDLIEEAEELISKIQRSMEIKHRIKQTAKDRRNELMDELFGWALQGYCVDLIDEINLHTEDLSVLEETFSVLRNKIDRLKRMEEVLNALNMSDLGEVEIELRSALKDVDRVAWVEEKVMELQGRAREMGKIEGDMLAVDANIERIKELEETWQKLKERLLAEAKARRKAPDKG
jgi:KaiC/GvpD/RAD55 family RecA-like ATPase